MSRIKRFLDFTKKKVSDFIYPKCDKCGQELTNYGTGGLNPEPLYICENPKCEKKIINNEYR